MRHKKRAMYSNIYIEDEIYYWSLHENQILKKFIGHTDMYRYLEIKNRIVWLDLSPVSDDFISCSRDGTLRIWNLSS